ncbi:kinesin-like protein KIF14 isoform X2 [Portunus trituberculatus]|nr:kinesin-like protein KIF14 isoform X2 [Portunus trituberculatus]XP_045109558.1 kinesin-like protein KIF14 isoform X2 [Portunus trituberculatus]
MEKIGQVSRTSTAASPRLGSARSTPRLRTPSSMPGPTSSSRPRGLPSRVTGTPTTPSLGSKMTSNGTPSVTGGSGVKRLQKESDSGRAKLPVQRSRSTHELVVEGKEDMRERNNLGIILNSNVNNISTPTRKSGVNMKGYSCGSKPTTPSRSSSGRPSLSSKRSLGGNTPTPTVSRRSGGSKLRVSGHAQFLQDGCPSVTPDVCRKSWSNTCSPDVDVRDGRAETTSVSVAVRVRPFNAREKDFGEDRSILEVLGNTVKITQDSNTAQSFTFDHCFWSCDENHPQYASQEHVYNAIAVPLLEKAYEGYNTCLFAYGQTGSGKSYTMLGENCLREIDSTASVTAGVIPRFCADFIQKANSIHAHNPPEGQLPHTQVEVELSYLEIYNEQIYDLLGGMSSSGSREPLRVREDPRTGPYVEGIACHAVSSMEHLMTWLMLGNRERSIAATGLNDKSSRSHAVFTLKLTQTQTEDVEGEELESSKVSILNLVDLAGSERVGASLSHGDRLKEGVFINKSLLTLGKVINSLAESEGRKRPFIPYRESVLTFLLKESLGGNSRTAMIATVSPSAVNIEETRSTLRYAQQTRRIINHNYVNEDPTAVIIRSLKKEVERLRLQQLAKVSPLLLMGEDELVEEQNHNSEEGDRDKILMEKERHILEREKEMNQLIEAKEREILLLREQVRCHQVLNEKTKSLEQRLKETEMQQQQALDTLRQMGVAEKNEGGPVLINLNEDPQLSEKLSYKLKIGTTCIGSSDCDLLLPGLHTDNVHCSIFNDKGRLKLIPRADADTYINGKLAEGPVTLSHSDRLILAGIYFFKVSIPHQANKKTEKSFNVDFYFTKEELLKEQEKRLQKEAEEAVALSKAEMERELEWHKQQLLCDVQDAHTQLVEKERRVCELQGAHWKLQQEKRLLEEKLNKGQQHIDLSPESLDNPQSNFLYEVEAVLNESVMEVKKESSNIPPMLSFRIKEANQICRKLRKAYEFMIQEVLSESGLEVVVVVKDLHHQMTATLSPASFTDVLQLLRTSAKDEDTDVFENGLRWEKAEDVTCVPGFLNRLLECSAIQNCNLSINSSFNTSSSSIFSYSKTRKMNNFRHLSEMSIREIPQNECRVSVGVAAALHQVLETLPASYLHTPILSSALSALCCLYEDAVHIKDHTTEPGHTLSEEELSKSLIQLFYHSQSVISSIAAAGNSEAVILAHGKDQFQDDIQKNIMKLSNCTSRLFQGVKTETESLVEESSATLIRLVHNLVEEVAKLSLLTALPMPDTSFFKPGEVIGGKFTGGLRIALECLVKQCGETASKATIRLATDMSQTSGSLSTAAFSTIDNIAAFLKKYAALNTTLDYEPKLSVENQRLKLVQWIDCVESAAETLTHLNIALMDIVNQTKLFQEGKMQGNFPACIKEVLKSLQNLMALAGLGPSLMGKGACLASYSRNKQLTDELRNKGRHAIKGMEKLEILCGSQNNTLESSQQETPIKYKEKVLTQWPKNSKEFQIYLQHNTPLKSSFQSSFHRDEKEKKVRFNVSHVSSVSFNSQSNGL